MRFIETYSSNRTAFMMLTVHGERRRQEEREKERRRETVENAGRVLPRVIRARCVRTKRVVALSRALIVTCHHTNAPRRNCSDGVPGRLRLGINARITSASYHGLSRPVSCHALRTLLEPRARRKYISDRFSVGYSCEWTTVKCQAALSRLILFYL